MGESWMWVRESMRVRERSVASRWRRRSAEEARRSWAVEGWPVGEGCWKVSTETCRRLAVVGRVVTMVGSDGAVEV